MTTLQSTAEQKRLSQKLYEKRLTEEKRREAEERERNARRAEREASKPTRERLSKGDIEEEVVKYLGVRHRPKPTTYERYRERMEDEVQFVFDRLVEDAATADVKGVTINYDRTGGRAASDRMGGLGAVHAKQIEAYHRYTYLMESLTPRLQSVVRWLVIGECLDNGKRPTPADVGHYIVGWWRGEDACHAAGVTAMKIAGDILVEAWHAYNMEQRFREARVREMREVNAL